MHILRLMVLNTANYVVNCTQVVALLTLKISQVGQKSFFWITPTLPHSKTKMANTANQRFVNHAYGSRSLNQSAVASDAASANEVAVVLNPLLLTT